jgi:pilus assembly protein CpaB
MSPRRIIFIVVALSIMGFTIFLVRGWLNAQRAELEAQRQQQPVVQVQPSTMVLVAKGPLAAGQFLRPENLRWQAWPNDGIAPTYMVQGQHSLEEFIGAVVRSSLTDGDPVTAARVVKPGDRGFLAVVLDPGHRAVTVNLTPSAGVAGFILPGDHVDLIATMTIPNVDTSKKGGGGGSSRQNMASETVLKDVRVLALDQRLDDQSKEVQGPAKTATLDVTPKEAEIIAVVSDLGKLSLSLRSLATNVGDEVAAAQIAKGKVSFTYDSEATKLFPPPNAAHGVLVVRGTTSSQE